MAMHHLSSEQKDPPPQVTLPRFKCLDRSADELETEMREAAARVAEQRAIREGAEAWQQIGKAESFESWKKIGAALIVGRNHALHLTGANAPHGRRYSTAFNAWAKQHQFDGMQKSTRSWALALLENLDAIEAWRNSLSERERERCRNAQSVVRRWQRATQSNGKDHADALTRAETAWKHFSACMSRLPPDQAIPLWQAIGAQAAEFGSRMSRSPAAVIQSARV